MKINFSKLLGCAASGNGGTLSLTDPTAPNSARFYRVRQW
jgi:hypothetical protein